MFWSEPVRGPAQVDPARIIVLERAELLGDDQGRVLGSITPPAPSRIEDVCAPMSAIGTVAAKRCADVVLGVPDPEVAYSSARLATATLAAMLLWAVSPGAMGARSRTDSGMRIVTGRYQPRTCEAGRGLR